MNDLTVKIEQWAMARDLHTADPHKQMLKLVEEVGELAEGLAKSNEHMVVDGIGDIYVVLTILANQIGLSIEECVQHAYDEIKYRKGELINGVYVKESDLK